MAAHKHAEFIKAWADGKTLQLFANGEWHDVSADPPTFNRNWEYRIKPAEPEREYPVTQMSAKEAYMAFSKIEETVSSHWGDNVLSAINAGLRHACDNGQIVTRAEFDRAIGDRAARDKAIALAVGEYVGKTVAANIAAGLDSSNIDIAPIIGAVK